MTDKQIDQIIKKKKLSNEDVDLLCDWIEEQKKDLEE